jgi:hypothetical protein
MAEPLSRKVRLEALHRMLARKREDREYFFKQYGQVAVELEQEVAALQDCIASEEVATRFAVEEGRDGND